MKNKLNQVIQILICLGIWIIVIQNYQDSLKQQQVEILNTVSVEGEVELADFQTVEVDGNLDVNIAKINGRDDVFYEDDDGAYILLPVKVRN